MNVRWIVVAASIAACGHVKNDNNPGGVTGDTDTTVATGPSVNTGVPEPTAGTGIIGSGGGKISLGKMSVDFPKGAIASDRLISISVDDAAEAGYKVFSKVVHIEASTTAVDSKFIVSIAFADASDAAKLYWSNAADPSIFDEVLGIIIGDTYVAAVDHLGRGFVGQKLPVVVDLRPPPAPTKLIAHAGDTEIDLQWDASAQATIYKVQTASSAEGPFTTLSTTVQLKYTHRGLSNGSAYYYAVVANNADGDSAASALATATPADIEAPEKPDAVASNAKISLRWMAPLHASTHSEYSVYRDAEVAPIYTGPALSYDDVVVNGVAHSYYLRARDPAGNESADSTASEVKFGYRLPDPDGLVVTHTTACHYKASWGQVADAGVTKYYASVQVASRDAFDLTSITINQAASPAFTCLYHYDPEPTTAPGGVAEESTVTLYLGVCYGANCTNQVAFNTGILLSDPSCADVSGPIAPTACTSP